MPPFAVFLILALPHVTWGSSTPPRTCERAGLGVSGTAGMLLLGTGWPGVCLADRHDEDDSESGRIDTFEADGEEGAMRPMNNTEGNCLKTKLELDGEVYEKTASAFLYGPLKDSMNEQALKEKWGKEFVGDAKEGDFLLEENNAQGKCRILQKGDRKKAYENVALPETNELGWSAYMAKKNDIVAMKITQALKTACEEESSSFRPYWASFNENPSKFDHPLKVGSFLVHKVGDKDNLYDIDSDTMNQDFTKKQASLLEKSSEAIEAVNPKDKDVAAHEASGKKVE